MLKIVAGSKFLVNSQSFVGTTYATELVAPSVFAHLSTSGAATQAGGGNI